MSEVQEVALIETPLQLRIAAKKSVARWAESIVAVPETGRVHRPVYLDWGERAPVKIEVIEPIATGPSPVMLFVHGGGWVMGDLDSHHQLALRFAEQGFVVVALEYGLAPEEPFPAGYDDVAAVARWIVSNIERYGGDPGRLVIVGDSAGANLAAGVAVSEADLPIKATGLIYGVYDLTKLPHVPGAHGVGYVQNMHEAYLGKDNLHLLNDPRVSPLLRADRLPPSIIVVGTADPLFEGTKNLVQRLDELGIENECLILPEYPHGFMHLEDMPETLHVFRVIAQFLKRQVAPEA